MPQTPDYIRIADEITDDVRTGKVRPGDKAALDCRHVEPIRSQHPPRSRWSTCDSKRSGSSADIRGKGIYITDPKTWMREP